MVTYDLGNIADWISSIGTLGAVIVALYLAKREYRQYINSLSPLLSFQFLQQDGILYLTIENTGQSLAKDIRINIKELYDNGDRNEFGLDNLFNRKFYLFPKEKVQGIIGLCGGNMEQPAFPYIEVDITYIKGNDEKTENYSCTISFTRIHEETNNLKNLETSLKSISYSNNRMANYIEGRTLFAFDERNVLPKSSLAKDMELAFKSNSYEKRRIRRKKEKQVIHRNRNGYLIIPK